MTVHEWLCAFACYLNLKEYQVSVSDILASIQNLPYEGSVSRENIELACRICWCKNREQQIRLADYLTVFLVRYELNGDKLEDKQQRFRQQAEEKRQTLEKKRSQELDTLERKKPSALQGFAGTEEAVQSVTAQMEQALWNMDMEEAERLQKQLEHILAQQQKLAEFDRKKREILARYSKENEQIDKEIQKQSKTLKQIEKAASRSHRKEFSSQTAHNAVRAVLPSSDPLGSAKLTALKPEDKERLEYLIRRNASHFYTRMMRNLRAVSARKIDLPATIKQACKTDGHPLELAMTKPKRNRAELMIILDISGSCISASKVMLMFASILTKVFVKVRSYAFVNQLYDISDVIGSEDAVHAAEAVLDLIETRGVYSDYSRPLTQLYREHSREFRKDTTVIVIGDARNNRNPSAENCFKQLTRKAGRVYWLNTEPASQWGQGDSIAPVYGKYCRMREAVTVNDIISFIDSMR